MRCEKNKTIDAYVNGRPVKMPLPDTPCKYLYTSRTQRTPTKR